METIVSINGKAVNAKLAEIIETVFAPASVSANVGKRMELALFFAANLPALGDVKEISIETEKELITVNGENLSQVLEAVAEACELNRQFRESVEKMGQLYDLARESVEKNPQEKGQRGRKSTNIESQFAGAFEL